MDLGGGGHMSPPPHIYFGCVWVRVRFGNDLSGSYLSYSKGFMKFGWPTPPYNWQTHQSNYITLDVYSADVDFSQTIKTPSAKWFTGAARAKLSPDMTDEHFPFASLRLPTSPISWARSSGGNLDRMDSPLGRGRPRGNRENRMRGNRQNTHKSSQLTNL